MDYKCGHDFIVDFIRKGEIDFIPKNKEKTYKEPSHTFFEQLLSEAKEFLEDGKEKNRIYDKIIDLSRAIAYKYESKKSSSISAEEICSFVISVMNQNDPDLATAAMNLATNCFFFFGYDALISFMNLGFLDILHSIFDYDCPCDLYIEAIGTISNILSIIKTDLKKTVKERSIENIETDIIQNDIQLTQELLSLVDFDTIENSIQFLPFEKLINISNLLFRYVSFQDENKLKPDYFTILRICKTIFMMTLNVFMKDKDKYYLIVDELMSSIINVLSYLLIREKELFVSIIDTDIISESFSYFYPDFEKLCTSISFFLLVVINNVPIYLYSELFKEITLSQLLIICETFVFLRPISYLVLSEYIIITPSVSDNIVLLAPFVKIPIEDVINGETKLQSSALELITSIFCHTNDYIRAIMIECDFYSAISKCTDMDSQSILKVVKSILFYSNRLDVAIPEDCFQAIKEAIENLVESPIQSISEEAAVIYNLFTE